MFEVIALFLVVWVFRLRGQNKKLQERIGLERLVISKAEETRWGIWKDFTSRNVCLPTNLVLSWIDSLVRSRPLLMAPVYMKERVSQSDNGLTDLFGQKLHRGGHVIWIVSGIRERLADGTYQYSATLVKYYQTPDYSQIFRIAAGGMGGVSKDEYEVISPGGDWEKFSKEEFHQAIVDEGFV